MSKKSKGRSFWLKKKSKMIHYDGRLYEYCKLTEPFLRLQKRTYGAHLKFTNYIEEVRDETIYRVRNLEGRGWARSRVVLQAGPRGPPARQAGPTPPPANDCSASGEGSGTVGKDRHASPA